mmetsp:Transcript_60081/g.143145  ORF Transcript_60081/g.143145 Transcript_60081/m.143145 type:complete len:254 (+) Transcript_60081:834-1595(+)
MLSLSTPMRRVIRRILIIKPRVAVLQDWVRLCIHAEAQAATLHATSAEGRPCRLRHVAEKDGMSRLKLMVILLSIGFELLQDFGRRTAFRPVQCKAQSSANRHVVVARKKVSTQACYIRLSLSIQGLHICHVNPCDVRLHLHEVHGRCFQHAHCLRRCSCCCSGSSGGDCMSCRLCRSRTCSSSHSGLSGCCHLCSSGGSSCCGSSRCGLLAEADLCGGMCRRALPSGSGSNTIQSLQLGPELLQFWAHRHNL